ncbi:MAG TPA: sugar ABC transporter ATP-binding protein [Clostridiales bacterium]|nr:sugar ABC transporter ATP-binding protein [Clostridiales bacterium]
MNKTDALLQISGLNKHFGPTHANKNIALSLGRGEIIGLAGENGSGKSTLLSQIAGINRKDSGEMFLNGAIYDPASPLDAHQNKIAMVVQELGAVNNLSAGINVFLGRTAEFTRFGILNLKKLYRAANDVLSQWGLPAMPLRQLADGMTVETRKIIELARALAIDPDILLLDEITQSLSLNNRTILYEILKKLKVAGKSVILITHDIEEMIKITDRITVLRDGEVIGTELCAETTPDKIKTMMVGRKVSGEFYRADNAPDYQNEVILEVEQATVDHEISDVSFQLHAGEILGFCGLSDSGIHTVGKALYGLVRLKSGRVMLRQPQKILIENSKTALLSGMAYVPKDRDKEALMIQTSILENLCLPSYENLRSKAGYLGTRKLRSMAADTSAMFDVKSTGIDQKMSSLSGGNKQKINIGRWLVKDLRVLILDCPTRGVDVGVKAFIYNEMKEAKKKQLGIVLISDELTEVLGMADRLLIMKGGRLTGEIMRGKDFTEEAVIGLII